MTCPECTRLGRECYACRSMREYRTQDSALDAIRASLDSLHRRLTQAERHYSDTCHQTKANTDGINRLARRIEKLEQRPDADTPAPTVYTGWTDSQLVTALLLTEMHSASTRNEIASELLRRLERAGS